MRARTAALGALLLVLPSLCAAEELSVKVTYDENTDTVTLKAEEASYTLADALPVRILKWFDGKRITVDGVVQNGGFVFRQITEPKLDSTLSGVAFKDGLAKIRIGSDVFSVTGPGLKPVVLAAQSGPRSISFEGYVLRAPDGKPDVLIVKRVKATTNVPLFVKGRADPGTTVWIVGEAWWGLKATVLGPGGTRANTWWGDLTIGERVEEQPPASKQSITEGLDKG